MKLIHTSDWHLGHQLYGYDRTEEFLHFFRRLDEIIKRESPDALLVSGDIFDVSAPSAGVSKMFKDRLLMLQGTFPSMTIIVTAGNHDSASRIDVDRNLWKSTGIHVIGTVRREDGKYDFSENIIKVSDKGYVAAIPFVNRAFMPRESDEESPEKSFFRGVERTMDKVNKEHRPCVLMAHLPVMGCDREGHREAVIGGEDSMSADVFGETFSYIALGHIHKPQKISDRMYYSGSPVAISFDESYSHSVNIVELKEGNIPLVRREEIPPLRELVTFPKEGVEFKKALKLLGKLPDNDTSYIRLNVRQADDLPYGCMEMAVEKISGKKCRYCSIKYEKITETPRPGVVPMLSAGELLASTPREIAAVYFATLGIPEELSERYQSMIADIESELDVM